ncbi:hypothetical protein OG884_33920 [Streptosporangium sp. NBC_01755]|uniref:hypothetical protein n=1 Tax=unclassified Streptosporangium TaxID=2632669 RepID=UPI002DDBFF4C|nr:MULTISPECIES: hypothetical protein [unclassified Streptosporangium]WSA28807.1 hypothetical protein OIE13_13555 [Streptosporangium sp. NBC_01810]WSC99745.1 hypothetical protein OG884_33920 [Streptosporangium sp. NBC_01755]
MSDADLFPSASALATLRDAAAQVRPEPPPGQVVSWLARLRLLIGVPFPYLVVDDALLPPPESIRFFFLDRNWTDAACDGALSVAADARERAHLRGRHAELRDTVDRAERNDRHSRVRPGQVLDGAADMPVTGFLLRSRLVSGWPGLQVRASRDGSAVPTVRLERLAPAVLLAMFDGLPDTVTLEEPHQGVQFGFNAAAGGRYAVPGRDGQPAAGPVPFRPGGGGVVDMVALAELLHATEAAPLARRLLQFPFRQDFTGPPEPGTAFRPSITLADLGAAFEEEA